MSNLHAYFHLRNLGAFRQLLDARGVSGNRPADGRPDSGPRSWSQHAQTQMTAITQGGQLDNNPNARDALGRTVLHLACADLAPIALEFVRALLALPSNQIGINIQDTESGWTALHRALYAGNLPAAVLLLARSDIDTGIRDLEGMTSFDVYNATVEGTVPDGSISPARELLVWGSNRNATLGIGSADDRAYPEVIQLSRPAEIVEKLTGSARFGSVDIKSIATSRLHTSILTNEPRGNLEACGFGGVGRLGSKQHTQYSFSKVGGLENQTITAVALGLDHTLALTNTGDVLSWGMNRFHQLGYVIEPTDASGKTKPAIDSPEYQIQTAPKRVIGPLRKEVVIGIAACKTASVCWTAEDLYTWGTNSGQLGYTKGTPGWQVLPRKVATVSKVEDVAISDIAMACLLRNKELICFWNDSHFRIQFSPSVFPHRYKPPQALSRVTLAKVTCNDSAFAALSTSGEVFLFSLPDNPTPESSRDVRPQRVWTLRRSVAAARDVALGADGTIIVCTASGHVFVHAPKPVKGSSIAAGSGSGLLSTSYRTHKYQRVAGLTRVVAVAANSTGGFAALRADAKIDHLVIEGKSLAEAMGDTQPYLAAPHDATASDSRTVIEHGDDDDEEKEGIIEDVALARRLCSVVVRARDIDGFPSTLDHHILHGADMRLSGVINLPVHRAVILARSSILGGVLSGKPLSQEGLNLKYTEASSTLTIQGCHPLSVLVFLNYLYSDKLCAIWDSRIGRPIADSLSDIDAQPNSIRLDLQRFARALDLPALRHATDTLGKRTPAPTLNADFARLFYSSQPPEKPVARHDICLELADRSVFCHSVVLRARSPFFASFFDEPEWTSRRWDEGGVMVVDMKHLEWRSMEYVFRYMCGGEMTELFDSVGFVNSADEFIDFVFQVMAAANELMLEQLTEICSTVILRHITLNNCTTVLTDASPFYSPKLKAILHKYIAVNMESLLEKRTLDSLAHDTMKSLSAFARAQQAIKSPHTRSGAWIAALMDRQKEWLKMQDFPTVVVRSGPPGRQARTSPKLSPMGPTSPKTPRRISSFTLPPTPQRSGGARPNARQDEMFTMDEEGTGATEALPPARAEPTAGSLPDLPPPASSPTPISNQVWKGLGATKAERVDMRSIIANEAASSKPNRSPLVRITGFETTSQPASPSKTPQKERAQVSSRQPTQVATPPASASSSWRDPPSSTQRPNARPGEFPSLSESGTNARPRIASTPTPGPSPSSVPKPSAQPTNAPRPPRAPPVQAPLPPPAFPGLGPVIIPKRSTSGTENPRRRHASEAWTAPPPMPAPAPGPSGQVSFSEIQQQQNAQKSQHAAGKSKRSLLEIQAEEAERARVLQEEELARAREAEDLAAEMEFMQWWHAEEARVKKEMEGGKGGGGAGKGRRKGRGTGGKKNKGNQGSGPGPKTVASTAGP